MPDLFSPTPEAVRRQAPGAPPAALRWPGGRGLAISFVLNIEEGAELSLASGDERNEPVHEVIRDIQGVPDFCMQSHFDYGATAGYRRVLQRFVERGLPLTLNACGRALETTPWVGEDARRHGFEISGHGWRWESPAHMDEATERAMIARTASTIERLSGRAPVGWHCKSTASVNTRRLLQEHGGFLYDSDFYGDDLPFVQSLADGRRHAVLPYAFDTNDMRFFDRAAFVSGADFAGYVIDAINELRTEAQAAVRMMTIGLHARIMGRPARVGGLDAVLRHIEGCTDEVWVARREDIARHWLANA